MGDQSGTEHIADLREVVPKPPRWLSDQGRGERSGSHADRRLHTSSQEKAESSANKETKHQQRKTNRSRR
jgi:hypothetical protein